MDEGAKGKQNTEGWILERGVVETWRLLSQRGIDRLSSLFVFCGSAPAVHPHFLLTPSPACHYPLQSVQNLITSRLNILLHSVYPCGRRIFDSQIGQFRITSAEG